ncbi:MAG: zinc ribbon domain-containing protein [Candidatus Freyarchaeota archaeon]|nr:zinc ribbon domain-containing protein [Candidatus Jordarchaeia archaeon]MBS7269100.1 zinc ribbon domain-containing protein [Candidatus Jordarchaeia archaeon]MBS7279950.1 zinc ribbon domain-containing protein [Candidatus Jordarchaeia archaeon]
MAKTLQIALSIVLGALGLFAIILAFAYPSFPALVVGAIIILISIVSLVWGLTQKEEEETTKPKEPKRIKVEAEETKVPIKITKLESDRYKPVKPTRATVLAPNSIYCQYCGKQIPKDSIYCPNCGSYLE